MTSVPRVFIASTVGRSGFKDLVGGWRFDGHRRTVVSHMTVADGALSSEEPSSELCQGTRVATLSVESLLGGEELVKMSRSDDEENLGRPVYGPERVHTSAGQEYRRACFAV